MSIIIHISIFMYEIHSSIQIIVNKNLKDLKYNFSLLYFSISQNYNKNYNNI